jgi:hypothetical protein
MRYVATIFIVIAVVFLTVVIAAAHSDGGMKYPPECCHNLDCAPVDKADLVPPFAYAGATGGSATGVATLWVTTRHGRAPVPPEMTPRQSQDHRSHACIRAGKVVCYFLPPAI